MGFRSDELHRLIGERGVTDSRHRQALRWKPEDTLLARLHDELRPLLFYRIT